MTAEERKAWLAERRKCIGGSDAAAILGLSKWTTRLDVFLSKTTRQPDHSNRAMYRGRMLEPAILQMYANETGLALERPREILRHKSIEFIGASLDAVAARTIVVDAKTARLRKAWGEPGTDQVPIEYLIQMMHYLAVTDLAVADLAVLFGDFDFQIYRIQRDEELVQQILAAEQTFWTEHVLPGIPPGAMSTADGLKLFPQASLPKIYLQASAQQLQQLAQLATVRQAISRLEQVQEELEAQLKAAIGSTTGLQCGRRLLASWSNVKGREGLDAKRLQEELPQLYKVYAKQGQPTRRFELEIEAILESVSPSSQPEVERIEQLCLPLNKQAK